MMKNLLSVLCLCLCLSACNGMGFGQGRDLPTAHVWVESAEATAADLAAYSASHEDLAGDVQTFETIHSMLSDFDQKLEAAIAEGRTDFDAREILSALEVATKPLLAHSNPRVGQLAIAIRSALTTFRLIMDGGTPPPPPEPPPEMK